MVIISFLLCAYNPQVVESRRGRGHVNRLTRSLKSLRRSFGHRNRKGIARQVISDCRICHHILDELGRVIINELKKLCHSSTPSILRSTTPTTLCTFLWSAIIKELEALAPTFLHFLRIYTTVKERPAHVRRRKKTVRSQANSVIGLCSAIILRHRNQKMNLVQRLISLILYSGHSSTTVGVLLPYYLDICIM